MNNTIRNRRLERRVTRLEKLLGLVARSMLTNRQVPLEPVIKELATGVQHNMPRHPPKPQEDPDV